MHRTRLTLLWSALLAVSFFTTKAHAQNVQLANISYEGFRNIRTNGNNSTYGQALTHRYVNGELRFLTIALGGILHEFRIAGTSLGGTITQTTGSWDLNPTDGLNNFNGIWFEQAKNRLWLTSAQDYTNVNHQAKVTLISLGSNGSASAIKTFYLNVPAKRVYGGCNAVPAALVAQIGGPYVCGWGGYTSLVAQGGGASIGPTMYAIADPDTVANGGTMSARTVLDTASSRGLRKTLPVNYFDGGDSRQNPSSRPTSAPVTTAQWLSPNAQGLGWMTWGDSYYNTGMWIGTTYAAVASLCQGSCWYQSSTLAFDGRQFELHLWNGSTLGSDTLRRPTEMVELNLPRGNSIVWGGNSPTGNIGGATFDAVTGRIYMFGSPFGDDAYTGRLYSFIVNGAGGAAPPPAGDSTSPTVTLTSPSNGATASGTLTLTASASDNVGVAGVWFTVDNSTVGSEDTAAPYQASWNSAGVSNGSHTIRAHARDAAGNVTTSTTIAVTVNNATADSTAPSVALSAPASSATVNGTVTVSATASDNVGIAAVQFQLNGVNLGAADTASPYSISWNTTGAGNGTHTLRAIATDAAGNATVSASRVITVSNVSSDATAPTVSMSAPASNATVSGNVTVSASASDNVGVVAVQFTLNGVNLGSPDTSAPFSITWNTRGAANGSHTLRAVARDAAGNVRTSTSRSVRVSNATPDTTLPTVALSSPGSSTWSGTVTIAASASDASGIAGVQFTVNGYNLGSVDTSAPYTYVLDTTLAPNGSYVFGAIAEDEAGNTRTVTRTITINNVNSDPPSTTPPPTTTCTSIRPAADWICVNGGWLPPGMTAPSIVAPTTPQTPPPPSSTGCTSVRPGADWVCVNGGWLPPGISAVVPPISSPSLPSLPSIPSGVCTTIRPAADWVCYDGGWLPPSLYQSLVGVGIIQPQPSTPAPGSSSGGCSTPMPGANWVCRSGGWLPSNHPDAN